MAKDKKVTIVIKKIEEGGAGAHGGNWKVAFADFMTAMMCFFLVMWLLNQTPEVKAEVASYFSGPSMLEHDFTSYGAELTLEKLFLDLVNEPLKTAQNLLQPVDFTPNIMAMGSKKIAMAYVASELGADAKEIDIERDSIEFKIPESKLFLDGSAQPTANFVNMITKIQALTVGLEDSRVEVEAYLYQESVPDGNFGTAQRVASARKDLVGTKIKSSFEKPTNDIMGYVTVKSMGVTSGRVEPEGYIRIKIAQKPETSTGEKMRPLEDFFDKKKADLNVYDDFVKKVSEGKIKTPPKRQKRQ
jgi:chemotaxis protein MotB